MTSHHKFKTALMAGILAVALTAPAFAETIDAPIQPHQEGNVTFISGGIGDGEVDQMKAEAANYNFRLINSDPTGHYAAGTDVTIESRDGREVIRAEATGPLFYAQLPPGHYKITAVNGGQQVAKNIHITAATPTDMHLVWR